MRTALKGLYTCNVTVQYSHMSGRVGCIYQIFGANTYGLQCCYVEPSVNLVFLNWESWFGFCPFKFNHHGCRGDGCMGYLHLPQYWRTWSGAGVHSGLVDGDSKWRARMDVDNYMPAFARHSSKQRGFGCIYLPLTHNTVSPSGYF